jgi:hypothetical protein
VTGYRAQFRPLPEGVTIKKVIWTATELIGKPELLPFEFNDLPIPPLPE